MNFGGGSFQNGQYQNVPPVNPMGQPVQPPVTGMPVFPGMPLMPMPMPMPMASVHPGMMPAPPLQTNYPEGQGPLAHRPVQRGANGLLQAPEPDGPEEHDALQYLRLNPAEELKYGEYWGQACEGADSVSGAHAVEFLSRATKVSKGQLRRIWDIADHRKEGALDQKQFFVALRLLALAQRGAELSVAGLRNFTGIQLIPAIDPPPEPEPEPEPEEAVSAPNPQKLLFSWMITPEVAARYDNFFKTLDVRNDGMIDGKQGVTFFGKSGLPRPTLKKIWGLADVTQDGMLSLDEFRTAMHMVTCIRNKRLAENELPHALNPNGPNWLRVAGAEMPAQASTMQPNLALQHPVENNLSMAATQESALQSNGSPEIRNMVSSEATQELPAPQISSPAQESVILAPPPMPTVQNPQSSPDAPRSQIALQNPPPLKAPMPDSAALSAVTREAELARKEAENMRDALRQEKIEFERARREMQEMRAEMERLRIERESLASQPLPMMTAAPIPVSAPSPLGQNAHVAPVRAYPTITPQPSAPSVTASASNGSSVTQASSPSSKHNSQVPPGVVKSGTTASKPVPTLTPSIVPPKRPESSNVPTSPSIVPSAVANRNTPIDLGAEDDEIWDQPSPKASALPGPSNVPGIGGTNPQSQDSVSSDDDDDFWGGAMAPKPTLGPAGGQKQDQNGSKGFGGSELDDWVF